MHSYSLLSQIDEFMEGNAKKLITDKKIAATCFNEDDPYWQLYKSSNAGASQIDLEEQISEFLENQADYKKLQEKIQTKKATGADMLNLMQERGEI